jgi:hypothetical protein
MTESLYRNLEWLARPSQDFTKQCRLIPTLQEELGDRLRSLANAALDENQLYQLAKLIKNLKQINSFHCT